MSGAMVVEFLERAVHERGYSAVVRLDNGPEFAGTALDIQATRHHVRLDFIDPGKPMQHAFWESCQFRLRDECLNQHWFISVPDAKRIPADYREHYTLQRPHRTLKYLAPMEFAHLHRSIGREWQWAPRPNTLYSLLVQRMEQAQDNPPRHERQHDAIRLCGTAHPSDDENRGDNEILLGQRLCVGERFDGRRSCH